MLSEKLGERKVESEKGKTDQTSKIYIFVGSSLNQIPSTVMVMEMFISLIHFGMLTQNVAEQYKLSFQVYPLLIFF